MGNLVCFEVLTKEQFDEKTEVYMCELEGVVNYNDTVWSNTQNIMNRQFYNEKGDEINFLYRKDDETYEIFVDEEDLKA